MEVAVFLSSILVLYFIFLLFVFIRTFCVFVYIFFAVRMLLLCIRLKIQNTQETLWKEMWSDSRFCLFSTDTICYNCSSMQLKLDLFQPVWTNCNSETFTFEFQLMKSLHFVRQTYLQMFYFLNHVFKVLVTANRKKIIKNIYLINNYMKKISHFNYKLSCYLLFNV